MFLEEKALGLLEKLLKNDDFDGDYEGDPQEIYVTDPAFLSENSPSLPKPADFRPILTKPGYFTVPPFQFLANCAYESLKNVEDFCIFNENGKVQFLGNTDLSFVNFDEVVEISEKFVEIYPDPKKKPSIGLKLNKPAVITFNRCKLWRNKGRNAVNHKKCVEKLRFLAENEVS